MKTPVTDEPLTPVNDTAADKTGDVENGSTQAVEAGVDAPDTLLNERIEAVEAIKKFTNEDDSGEFSLRAILGGDILQSRFILKQVLFIFYVVVLCLLYTANRYSSQQDAILVDSLRTHLQNVKYNVMTQSSELLNMTRQSNIEKQLHNTKDSLLHNPVTPPYLILKDGYDDKPPLEEEVEDPNLPTGDEV